MDEAQLLVCEKPHNMPHHRRTNSTPSPYQGRFILGFHNEIRGCTRVGTAMVLSWYGAVPRNALG